MAGVMPREAMPETPAAEPDATAEASATSTDTTAKEASSSKGARSAAMRPGPAPGLWALVRRHPTFAAVLGLATLLRVVTMLGYQPAMYFNDSFDYLHVATKPFPHPLRPDGYAFFLYVLKPFHSFALVVGLQHLMGLGIGVMIYALLRRRFRLPGWAAALAAAPTLLDAYQIQLEHLILSDTLFTFLVMGVVTLLLWHERTSWKIAAAVGLLLGIAWLTRSVGLPVLVGVLVFLLVRRTNWRVYAALLAACALPVTGYMVWFNSYHHKFAMTESSGVFLYARVYKFADCNKIKNLPVEDMVLCVRPQVRLPNSQDGIWNTHSPLRKLPGQRFSPYANEIAGDFSKRAIMAQPDDYLKVVAGDFFRVFRWDRTVFPDRATYEQYEFLKHSSALPDWRMSSDATAADEAVRYEQGRARTRVVEPFATVIRGYQDVFFLRGPLLGIILLAGLAGMVAMWRRFGGAALLPWTLATGLLLAPAATAEFDYRYILPALPLAGLAAGIAFSRPPRTAMATAYRRVRGRTGTGSPAPEETSKKTTPEDVPVA